MTLFVRQSAVFPCPWLPLFRRTPGPWLAVTRPAKSVYKLAFLATPNTPAHSTGTPSCRTSFLGARQSNAFTSPPAFQRELLVHYEGEGGKFIQDSQGTLRWRGRAFHYRNVPTACGQIVHGDECGQMHVNSPSGARSFLLLKEDYSQYRHIIFIMRLKSGTRNWFGGKLLLIVL